MFTAVLVLQSWLPTLDTLVDRRANVSLWGCELAEHRLLGIHYFCTCSLSCSNSELAGGMSVHADRELLSATRWNSCPAAYYHPVPQLTVSSVVLVLLFLACACKPGDQTVFEKGNPPEERGQVYRILQELLSWCTCKRQNCSRAAEPRSQQWQGFSHLCC